MRGTYGPVRKNAGTLGSLLREVSLISPPSSVLNEDVVLELIGALGHRYTGYAGYVPFET